MIGVFGVAAAPLLPRVLRRHFSSSSDVHFRWVRGFGQVAQAVPYFLQHLLAVATVVAGGESFGSHLSVSFGFLSSLHVRACMMTMKGMKRMSLSPGLQHRVAGVSDVCFHICMLLKEMCCEKASSTHAMLPNRLGKTDLESTNYLMLSDKH